MRYAEIKKNDVANGPGVRVSLWTQGCPHRCEDCFNFQTWDYDQGKEFTADTIDEILKLLKNAPVKKDFSILGGEPLIKRNRKMLLLLLKVVKNNFPEINIWLWTGYEWEDIKDLYLLKLVDVIVVGKFEKQNKDLSLKFRGSSNQKIIDVQKSLKENKIITVDI